MTEPTAICDAALAIVVGGAGKSNTDSYTFQWKAKAVGEDVIAYPDWKQSSSRTDYGACIDRGVAACNSAGGSNGAIGQCKLNTVANCDQTTPQQ